MRQHKDLLSNPEQLRATNCTLHPNLSHLLRHRTLNHTPVNPSLESVLKRFTSRPRKKMIPVAASRLPTVIASDATVPLPLPPPSQHRHRRINKHDIHYCLLHEA